MINVIIHTLGLDHSWFAKIVIQNWCYPCDMDMFSFIIQYDVKQLFYKDLALKHIVNQVNEMLICYMFLWLLI